MAFRQLLVLLDRAVEQNSQVALVERFEHIYLTAAQQRRYDLERGVLGGGADERYHALLDGSQQRILLRLVEAVDLVDEQKCRTGVEQMLVASLLDHFAYILHAAGYGRQGVERTVELRRYDLGQRRLAYARRPPQYERRYAARRQKAAEHAALADQMSLTYILVERMRPQPLCQWNRRHT